MDGELRTYEIVNIDDEGWIKIQRHGAKGHSYLHETINKHFLAKLGYVRSKSEKK
tara:strand:- start:151 stop:315 length:165 start_codon:yes stop_codon:yes gene_type:complete